MNSIRKKEFKKALQIAFQMDKPMRIHQIFDEMMANNQEKEMTDVLSAFDSDMVERCLLYIRDWNTNAKQAYIAQKALNVLLTTFDPESLSQLPRMKEVSEPGRFSYSHTDPPRIDPIHTTPFPALGYNDSTLFFAGLLSTIYGQLSVR